MNQVLAERIEWHRRSRGRHYVGTLSGTDDGFQLAGREPASGIQVSLSIPYGEINDVRLSGAAEEEPVGEPSVMLQFSESEPILLREIGIGRLRPKVLVARLKEAMQ